MTTTTLRSMKKVSMVLLAGTPSGASARPKPWEAKAHQP